MRAAALLAIMLAAHPAIAADKALILNDNQQRALREIFDAAVRAGGLSQVSRNAFILSDMLDAAPAVAERKETPEPKKEGDK